MSRNFLICVALLIGGCHGEFRTDHYPFSFASGGEVKFFNQCIQEAKECRWLRFTQQDGGEGYTSTDIYSFPASADFDETTISMPCKRMIRLKAWSSSVSDKAIKEFVPTRITKGPEGICSLMIPRFHRIANANGFNFLRIEQVVSTALDPFSVNVTYRFAGNAKTKIILQSGSNSELYIESNVAKSTSSNGYHKIENGNGTVLEFESAWGGGSYLGISSQNSWSKISATYRTKAGAGGGQLVVPGTLNDALSRFAKLRLAYLNDSENSGFLPRLEYSDVLARGKGDCKDMVVVMMRVLAGNGIDSQPVLMGIRNGIAMPPTLRNLPDLAWPNHVILYLPNLRKFIDPTLAPGHYAVDRNYQWYGAIGVNLESEKRVIVGQ